MSEPSYPDIEIYVAGADLESILDWLRGSFTVSQQSATRFRLTPQGNESARLECVIFPDAVEGGFTSVWFRPNVTPWPTDLDCARSAFACLNTEIRCSGGSWDGADNDAGWLQINASGVQDIHWK